MLLSRGAMIFAAIRGSHAAKLVHLFGVLYATSSHAAPAPTRVADAVTVAWLPTVGISLRLDSALGEGASLLIDAGVQDEPGRVLGWHLHSNRRLKIGADFRPVATARKWYLGPRVALHSMLVHSPSRHLYLAPSVVTGYRSIDRNGWVFQAGGGVSVFFPVTVDDEIYPFPVVELRVGKAWFR